MSQAVEGEKREPLTRSLKLSLLSTQPARLPTAGYNGDPCGAWGQRMRHNRSRAPLPARIRETAAQAMHTAKAGYQTRAWKNISPLPGATHITVASVMVDQAAGRDPNSWL
jgi:hypothetical protein